MDVWLGREMLIRKKEGCMNSYVASWGVESSMEGTLIRMLQKEEKKGKRHKHNEALCLAAKKRALGSTI